MLKNSSQKLLVAKKSNEYFNMFNNLNKTRFKFKTYDKFAMQLKDHISNHSSTFRNQFTFYLELLHLIMRFIQSEIDTIKKIATYMNINPYDFESIKSMIVAKGSSDSEKWYKILGITKNATNVEVKKAYRKMAVKYHPDKLIGVSEDIKNLAEEKFLAVKEAYEQIMKSKN